MDEASRSISSLVGLHHDIVHGHNPMKAWKKLMPYLEGAKAKGTLARSYSIMLHIASLVSNNKINIVKTGYIT